MAKEKNETAVAEVNTQTAVALSNQYQEDAGSGFEEAGTEAFAIPFLSILQSGSPQVKKSDGAYIKGAEEGMLFNSVTQTVYSGEDGVEIIPCHYTQRFIEWQLREKGGGFVGEHLPNDPIHAQLVKDDKGRMITPAGNQLVDTRNHYVLIRKDGTLTPAVMSLSSTQVSTSKQFMSMMQGQKEKNPANGMFAIAPMFSRVYRVTTVAKSNDKGSWFGYKFEVVGKVEDEAEYAEARSFAHAVKSGMTKVERNMSVESASNAKDDKF